MKFFVPPYILFALVAGMSCLWAQEQKTERVPAARDAVLFSEDAVDGAARANGKGDTLTVGNLQGGIYRRALIAFELEGFVPVGALVLDAKLSLTVSSTAGFGTPLLFIYRVNGGWAAGRTDPREEILGDAAQTGDTTWHYRNFDIAEESRRIAWGRPGGDFVIEQPLVADVPIVEGSVFSFAGDALTADVQGMVNRPDQHFGWILLGDERAFLTNFIQFGSSENADESLRPMLEITYVAPRDVDKVITNYDTLVTVAGVGKRGGRDNHWRARFEGGPALDAELSRPSTAAAAADGTIYFTDTYAHTIRKVTPAGLIETVAGTGEEGYNGDAGPAKEVQLDQPNGLVVMPNGNLYILDIDNKRVRKITSDGQVATVFHDETEPPFLTGRGLWVSPDEKTIVYGSRTAMKRWTASDGEIAVLASGFTRLTNLGRDPLTGDFLGTDEDDGKVWRVRADGSGRERIAGGGIKLASGLGAKDVRLEGVRGLAVCRHGGYFLTTEDGGDLWYVDPAGIAYVLLRGSGNGNIIGGEDQMLRELVGAGGHIMSQPYAITIAPGGDLILTTNDTGLIRVIGKGRAPAITGSRLDENGVFQLRWSSQVQRLYLVEGSEDLVHWQVLDEVPSSRDSVTFTEGGRGRSARRFYRVGYYYP